MVGCTSGCFHQIRSGNCANVGVSLPRRRPRPPTKNDRGTPNPLVVHLYRNMISYAGTCLANLNRYVCGQVGLGSSTNVYTYVCTHIRRRPTTFRFFIIIRQHHIVSISWPMAGWTLCRWGKWKTLGLASTITDTQGTVLGRRSKYVLHNGILYHPQFVGRMRKIGRESIRGWDHPWLFPHGSTRIQEGW